MPKKSSSNIEPYPSFPDIPGQGDQELPGELTPLEGGEGVPEPMPQGDPMQEFLDQYTPPFLPTPTPPPPREPVMKPSRPLTKPRGLMMAQHLYNRAMTGPKPMKGMAPLADTMATAPVAEDMKGAIVTQAPAALKQAIKFLGLASERNPNGIAISLKTARQLFFDTGELDTIEEAEFRAEMENGDIAIDKKNVRTFVNYDGSITYEILNSDKSIMSRFTIGEYKGYKVFVQGGYAAYAAQLRDVAMKMPAEGNEFDKIRQNSTGGV